MRCRICLKVKDLDEFRLEFKGVSFPGFVDFGYCIVCTINPKDVNLDEFFELGKHSYKKYLKI